MVAAHQVSLWMVMTHDVHLVRPRIDLVANGGASLTLVFERSPFLTQYHTVWIPWNVFYVMDTLVMKKEENDIPSCDLSGFVRPSPIIVSSPLSTFFRSSPEDSPIIPETQVQPCSWQDLGVEAFLSTGCQRIFFFNSYRILVRSYFWNVWYVC